MKWWRDSENKRVSRNPMIALLKIITIGFFLVGCPKSFDNPLEGFDPPKGWETIVSSDTNNVGQIKQRPKGSVTYVYTDQSEELKVTFTFYSLKEFGELSRDVFQYHMGQNCSLPDFPDDLSVSDVITKSDYILVKERPCDITKKPYKVFAKKFLKWASANLAVAASTK